MGIHWINISWSQLIDQHVCWVHHHHVHQHSDVHHDHHYNHLHGAGWKKIGAENHGSYLGKIIVFPENHGWYVGQIMENLWKTIENLWKTMEKIWKTHGKCMENHGKDMENHGKSMENHGKYREHHGWYVGNHPMKLLGNHSDMAIWGIPEKDLGGWFHGKCENVQGMISGYPILGNLFFWPYFR